MSRKRLQISAKGMILSIILLLNIIILQYGYVNNESLYWLLFITMPLLFIAIYNVRQRQHSVLRNYPLLGYVRYWLESLRPELRQYFFESDLDGKPFNRRQRSIVYQRAKNEPQTVAFGMQSDPQQPGYEWLAHSLYASSLSEKQLGVTIGNKYCKQPYNASVLNIGAMSYGALSKTAIQSLNEGAKLGGFAHNTGEGGISTYHLKGGDLIWQIGTGYFGCRDAAGHFDAVLFGKQAQLPQIKMIELKLSQGAKPGHGGILPAAKNTPEIAAIRHIQPNTTVYSPPNHTAFKDAEGLLQFIRQLRQLSGGKPVGFKLCIGDKEEFIEICNAICKTKVVPDFITVDGSEGGTGAAPLEFTDSLGMPLYDALAFVNQVLKAFGLKDEIKIIAAGKIITGFDILKALSLGAGTCYSARGMMLALGCIQALKCDSGKCPVGVATQEPNLYNGLDVSDKRVRVANFHANTIKATIEIMEACGFKNIEAIHPAKFFRRVNATEVKSFDEIYFPIQNTQSHFKDNYSPTLN